MTEINTIDIFNIVYPYVIAYIAGHGGAVIIEKIRMKIHGIREIIDTVDDAMTNGNVTEAQAQATWQIARGLLLRGNGNLVRKA